MRKAILPVAGLGTRFLPATKAIPKEMLPLVDKPLIQYVVEEGVAAGIEEFILVTSQGKTALEDHFDAASLLEETLRARGEEHLLASLEALKGRFTICSVRQDRPRGLGHAVLCARNLVGEEPFAVMLGDDIIDSPEPAIGQLLEAHKAHGGCIVAVMPVLPGEVGRYGIIAPRDGPPPGGGGDLCPIADLVEKPTPEEAPSELAVIGRYVLPPEVFEALERTPPDPRGEIQLTEGIRALIGRTPVFGLRFRGRRYDAGNKSGFLQATVALALQREDLGEEFRAFLRELKP